MLWVVLTITLATGTVNFTNGWHREATSLIAAAVACAFGLYLLAHGRVWSSAAILCVALAWAIALSSYYGAGMFDLAILGIPVLILIGVFALGTCRGLLPLTLASVAWVFTLSGVQAAGLIKTGFPVSWLRSCVAALMIGATATVAWFVHDSWERILHELLDSYEATLRGWAELLEARGGDVAGHSQRVTDLSQALAKRVGCGASELAALRRGAYLHDIGKMAIPDSILLKPGPLDPTERSAMERHSEIAASILSRVPFLRTAAPVARSHHERWDGQGYPDGLRGEAIPLVARIFTVADHFDALSSERVYRDAWSPEAVRSYMRENSSLIYDPVVIEALFQLLGEEGWPPTS